MIYLLLVCLPVGVFWIFMDKFLILIGQDHSISIEACKYAIWVIPALFVSAILKPVVRYLQSQTLTRLLLASSLVVLCFHVPLCWALIFKFKLGTVGAALAFSMSTWLYLVLLVLYIKFSASCETTRISFTSEAFLVIGQFFRLAVPSAVMVCTRVSNELGAGNPWCKSEFNDDPFNSYRGFTSHPLQEALTYPVLQPAATQVQQEQVPVKRNAEEEAVVVKIEPSKFPNSKPRLIWTPELHARFIQAVKQLGGLFKATPKAMLGIMNVKGLTHDHLKSHLQRIRKKCPNDISAEAIMGHGIQNNANSHAPEITEGEASSSTRPKLESNIGKYGRLLGSYEDNSSGTSIYCTEAMEIILEKWHVILGILDRRSWINKDRWN